MELRANPPRLTVDPEHDEHCEEDDGPDLRQRQVGERLREDDEHEARALGHHALHSVQTHFVSLAGTGRFEICIIALV